MIKAKKGVFPAILLSIGVILYLRTNSSSEKVFEGNVRILNVLKQKYCVAKEINLNENQKNLDYQNVQKLLNLYNDSDDKFWIAANTQKNEDFIEYIKSLIPAAGPWIIFALISLISFLFFILCCCCDRCCPPCQSCRRKKKYTVSTVRICSIILIICSLGLIGISIAGFTLASKVEKGAETVICGFMSVLDDGIYGTTVSSNQTWLGTQNFIAKLSEIISNVNTTAGNISNLFANTSWADNGLNNLYSLNNQIYTNNNATTLNSPKPGALPTDKNLGPSTSTSTMTGTLKQEVDLKAAVLLNAISSSKIISNQISSSTSSIQSYLSQGLTSLTDLQTNLNKVVNSVQDYADKADNNSKYLSMGMYIFWAVYIFGPVLILLSEILTKFFWLKDRSVRFLLHISWSWMLFFTFIGFIVAAILNTTSVIIHHGCNNGNKILADPNFFNSFSQLNVDIRTKINICLFGNGDLLSQFNIRSQINQFNNLSTEFNSILNETSTNNSGQLGQITSLSVFYDNLMVSYINGSNAIIDSSATDDLNPIISIGNYTKWTDSTASGSYQSSLGNCQISKDEWRFSLINCTKTQKWQSGFTSTSQLGSDICIDIKSFDVTKISQRYSSASSCSGGTQTQITSYFNALKNYDNSRTSAFTSIRNDLTAFSNQNNALINQVNSLVTNLKNIQGNINTLLNDVSQAPNGIIYSVNCKFIGNGLRNMLDSACVSFLTPSYIVTILLIVASIVSLLASYIAYFKAMDSSKKLRGRELYQDYEMGPGKIM